MAPPAGHAARAVGGPAPVLPGVPLLLALLGAQEEEAVVRQQDSETRQCDNLGVYFILGGRVLGS